MDVNEYRKILHDDMALNADINITSSEEEFLIYVTDLLSSADEFDDFVECYYEGKSRKAGNPFMRMDGYAFDDADGSCCIFISSYKGPYDDEPIIRAEDVKTAFNRIKRFVEEANQVELFDELEESTEVYEFAKFLHFKIGEITKFRFYYITDAYSKLRKKRLDSIEVAGVLTELNVWDIDRIFDIVNSTTKKESVEIFLSDYNSDGIPCVKAVEYNNVLADIDLSATTDLENNLITYTSYLAVVPGEVLNQLYLDYGSRLLEGNVRSFLSVKGKVNKAIQNTIKNYPEMFFAYNNGIAATATEIDTEMTKEGLVIKRIKNLQIVNGGQTTASIANTLLHLKKDETVDVSKLFVPLKISVLEHSMAERIIPKISEYSNSQNKVDASDFFSNHPFHIRMEELSRKTPAPAIGGNQFQQYWFYERTRGQYDQGKMKFKAKSKELKQYENRYPKNQVIKMVDLAKYMELYYCNPHIVGQGKQAVVKQFAETIKPIWKKSNDDINAFYFKRIVAIAILFKKTDEIIKNTQWYKEKRSYKANVTAYTLSVLFNHINELDKKYELDFMRIWNKQEIYPELKMQLENLCTEVYEFITREDRPIENVTQWCKKELCWKNAKKEKWTFYKEFENTLINKEEIAKDKKTERETQEIRNELEDMTTVLNAGDEYWMNIYTWGTERKLLNDKEIGIYKVLSNIQKTGKIPTERQIKVALKARERLLSEGMPIKL